MSNGISYFPYSDHCPKCNLLLNYEIGYDHKLDLYVATFKCSCCNYRSISYGVGFTDLIEEAEE